MDQPTPTQAKPMPLTKLVNLLGATRGEATYLEVLDTLQLEGLRGPDDNARFGEALISRGGVLAAIGRSIKLQAILHGAAVER